MLGRDRAPFRLDVRVPSEHLFGYLDHLRWPVDLARLESNAAPFLRRDTRVQLNLPVCPEQGGQLDLELFTGDVAHSGPERERVLEVLCRSNLASKAKAEILRSVWENTPRVDALARSWYLKLRFQGAVLHEVKAYLGLMPRMSRKSATQARVL